MNNLIFAINSERAKFILDTRVFAAAKTRFQVHIFSYLVKTAQAQSYYGDHSAVFHDPAQFFNTAHSQSVKLADIARVAGFQYRNRGDPWVGLKWDATYRLRSTLPVIYRSYRDRLALSLIAGASSRAWVWKRLLDRATERALNGSFAHLIRQLEPSMYVCCGVPDFRSLVLARAARRMGFRTMLIPVSADEVLDAGYLSPAFDYVCAWGERMTQLLVSRHGIPQRNVVPLGNLSTRLQTECLQSGVPEIRPQFRLDSDAKIVTYLSVLNSAASETIPAVRYLAGQLAIAYPKAAIVVRTSPWEDAGLIIDAFRYAPNVRVQNTALQRFDSPGIEVLAAHAALCRSSSVVIMGSPTSSLFQTCVWGVPTIVNDATLRPEAGLALSPADLERADPSGLLAAGMPVAHSLDDLVTLTLAFLRNPDHKRETWAKIAAEWDYQVPDYVERFLRVVQ